MILFSALGRTSELLHAIEHEPMNKSSWIEDGNDTKILIERPKISTNYTQYLTVLKHRLLNPQLWMINYKDNNPNKNSKYLWATKKNKRIAQAIFNSRFKTLAGLPLSCKLDSTVFRSGGTTFLVETKQPLDYIRILGRWNSDAFRLISSESFNQQNPKKCK